MKRMIGLLVLGAALCGCAAPDDCPCLNTRGCLTRSPDSCGQAGCSRGGETPGQPLAAARRVPSGLLPQYLPAGAHPESPNHALGQEPRTPAALASQDPVPGDGTSAARTDPTRGRSAPVAGPGKRANGPAGVEDQLEPVAHWEEEPEADAPPGPEAPGPAHGPTAVIASKRIQLNFEVKDVGPSGVSAIELWYTHNGGNWQKYPGNVSLQPPYVVEVSDDGLYGFTLVARNGAGVGKPPQHGEAAQVCIEVDQTKPAVRLVSVKPEGAQARRVAIAWKSSDKNLDPHGTALLWARDAAGPWLPIASGLEGSGRYTWKVPADLQGRCWVRVETTDLAGNVATVDSAEPVVLDSSRPTVSILAAEPAAAAPVAKPKAAGPALELTDE